jgi:hypothetical protein
MTRLRRVAPRKMAAVSRISTMKVLSPRATLSLAPTRESTRSTTPTRAREAGTKPPIWAITTVNATCRINVDLPAMFGPVTSQSRSPSTSRRTSFGTKRPAAASRSTTGWRASMSSMTVPSSILGRT